VPQALCFLGSWLYRNSKQRIKTLRKVEDRVDTTTLKINGRVYEYDYLQDHAATYGVQVKTLPFCIRSLALNLINAVRKGFGDFDLLGSLLLRKQVTIPFLPTRMLLQDLLGVPVMADLAAMRDAMAKIGQDPAKIDAVIPVDFIIDHSLKAVCTGSNDALTINEKIEAEQNRERFEFLRWCQASFKNVNIIPPGTGILHQINIEKLAKVVWEDTARNYLLPDTVLGTDSHTPMVNGLGIIGWGVGGLEAEAAILGRPVWFTVPPVVGVHVTGKAGIGITPTDIVLHVTEKLRHHGVIGKFVEFYGEGLKNLVAPDRTTIANMAPEFGATCAFFPVDRHTIDYLRLTGRTAEHCKLVDTYTKRQSLWLDRNTPHPQFDECLDFDLSELRPSLAGPKRPQDRINLDQVVTSFKKTVEKEFQMPLLATEDAYEIPGQAFSLSHGDIVIAAITGCTNTSNPRNMITAALLAKAAFERSLFPKPWVKTSFAPGSMAVPIYLTKAGLQEYLDKLGFQVIGYGCTSCNGMSGPLDESIEKRIRDNHLIVSAVLSGNRNFEARIHPLCRANYITSPCLVIAYAIAGNMIVDLTTDPLGRDLNNKMVYLRDLWPNESLIDEYQQKFVTRDAFNQSEQVISDRIQQWGQSHTSQNLCYEWNEKSTYIQRPPFLDDIEQVSVQNEGIMNLRPIMVLGDSITTDHISPSGAIAIASPAGKFLAGLGVTEEDFNSYGTRRGNHLVAMRATFANIRLKNEIAEGAEGWYSKLFPEENILPVFDVAQQYLSRNEHSIVIAGKEYGSGSSRDWAAKGVKLLGVKVVLAESFERIHRSNLIGMGILPLIFTNGQTRHDLKLDGSELLNLHIHSTLRSGADVSIKVIRKNGQHSKFLVQCALLNDDEILQYRHGGLLPLVIHSISN
jgi:aconitate hydratase